MLYLLRCPDNLGRRKSMKAPLGIDQRAKYVTSLDEFLMHILPEPPAVNVPLYPQSQLDDGWGLMPFCYSVDSLNEPTGRKST
jgi:hypothetical protein